MIRYAEHLGENCAAIFLFHGVIREQRHGIRNYTRKHLSQARFRLIVEELRAEGAPISMPELLAALASQRRLPARSFAITFDDGFENNYSVAAPILRSLEIPATFYVTTAFIESNAASWIDLIEYAVERTPAFELSLAQAELRGAYTTREEKLELLNSIRRVVKRDRRIDPYAFADEVWRQLRVTAMEPDASLDQKMAWDQVRDLGQDPRFTIGGHGHTHRILEHLNQPDLEQEIGTSMTMLRAQLGRTLEHYSYPEGLAHCYSERVIDVLRSHGIRCAVTAEPGTNSAGADPFRLKRIAVNS